MSNELTGKIGMPVTLQFLLTDVPGTATTALVLKNGGLGLKVPTGYKFQPLLLHGECNTAVLTGTGTFKVTADTAVLVNGPTAALTTTVQAAVGVQRSGVEPIEAGEIIGVSIVTSSFTPTTGDVDVILVGVFTPA